MATTRETAEADRVLLCQTLGVELDAFVLARQSHSANVRVVSYDDRGRGARREDTGVADTDGLIATSAGVVVAVLVADCAPVLLADVDHEVVAAVHAGRKGTLDRIVQNAVSKMQESGKSDPSRMLAFVGPSICSQHYPVGKAAVEELERHDCARSINVGDQGTTFDLKGENLFQLLEAGLSRSNIDIAPECTWESSLLYSERRDGSPTGRFMAGIWTDT